MIPVFVDIPQLLKARNLWDLPCVTIAEGQHRLYVRSASHSYRVDFCHSDLDPFWMCLVYYFRGREVVNTFQSFSILSVFAKFKTMFNDCNTNLEDL